MMEKEIRTVPIPIPISTFLRKVKIGHINLSPDYQRDFIWNKPDIKEELIKSILFGFPIGSITTFVASHNNIEVIDGQQRLTTIKRFVEGDIKFKKINRKISDLIIQRFFNQIKLSTDFDEDSKLIIKNYVVGKTTLSTYKKLSVFLKEKIDSYALSTNEISGATREEIRQYFRVVQNQERLKAGEIINSLSDNWITALTSNKDVISSLNKIKFNNKRNEFTKYVIGFLGIKAEKIKMGDSDAKIIKYALNVEYNKEFEDDFKKMIDYLQAVNFVSYKTFSKLSMKLLLIVLLWIPHRINEDKTGYLLESLVKISNNIGKLNSSNFSVVEKAKKLPYYKHLNRIWIISKKTHNISTVEVAAIAIDNLLDFELILL